MFHKKNFTDMTGIDVGDDLRPTLGSFSALLQQNNLRLLLEQKKKRKQVLTI